MQKQYVLAADQIQPLAEGYGGCLASDQITVRGRRVAFMYRQAPDNEIDSGWRFFSGFESAVEMEDPDAIGPFDVNTIANMDPEIIPFLDAPIGAAYERSGGSGSFAAVDFEPLD